VYVEGATGYADGIESGTAAALAAAAGTAAAHVSGITVGLGAGEELPPPQPAAETKAHPARTARCVSGDRFTFDTDPT
jgi:hypothetical protein